MPRFAIDAAIVSASSTGVCAKATNGLSVTGDQPATHTSDVTTTPGTSDVAPAGPAGSPVKTGESTVGDADKTIPRERPGERSLASEAAASSAEEVANAAKGKTD